MSDAFRSQLEAAEEKVRRAGEQIATLKDDVTKLERRLSPSQKPLNLWVAAVLIAALTAAPTAAVVSLYETRGQKVLEAEAAAAKAMAAEAMRSRDEAIRQALDEKDQCKKELASCRSPDSPPPFPSRPSCNCQPGDPLCTCLDDARPFDRGAAAAGLGGVNVRSCSTGAEDRSIHVQVVFDPTGTVSVVTIDQGNERLSTAEGTCVTRLVKNVHVPAFSGAPVKVGKSYTLTK